MSDEFISLQNELPITFGGASLSGEGGGYGFGELSDNQAEKLIKTAFDLGIRLFDTAPIYGFGLSEVRLGKYLPKDALVVSKSGVDWHSTKRVNMTNSAAVTEKMLHQSLKRLQRDQIFLYMIHWPNSQVDIRVPMEVLKKAQDQGKIKHIGLCNSFKSDIDKAQEIAKIEALQSELNLLNQKGFELLGNDWKNFFSMAWGTFDKGILTGRVSEKRSFSPEDCRSWAPWWNKKTVLNKIKKTKILKNLLDKEEITLQDFCIHFNLKFYQVSTTLVGCKKAEDLIQVISSLQKSLSLTTIERIYNEWNKLIESQLTFHE